MGVIAVCAALLFSGIALAQSSSSSYRMDYGRTVSDAGSKQSSTYNLIGAMTEAEVDGASSSYNLRNVYAAPLAPVAVCGNGIIEAGEQCDLNNFGGLTCANFGYNSGFLQCTNCQIITTFCYTTTGITGICGNGLLEPGEQCDDGNTISGDGCSSGCRFEEHRCGNGIRETGEECDDGNTKYGDGCTPECKIEGPEIPPEIPPEVIPPEELKFAPEIIPAPYEIPVEIVPKPPIAPPVAPPVPVRPVAPPPGKYSFHFEYYDVGAMITVLDETPFIVTQLEPDGFYELVIYDQDDRLIGRQGAQADQNGILKVESSPYLDYKTYKLQILNKKHELENTYNITIEDRQYRLHEATFFDGEDMRETIYLGEIEKDEYRYIAGKGKPDTQYYAYYTSLKSPPKNHINPINYVKAVADENGDFAIPLPEDLEPSLYHLDLVQVYEDGKVSRNKRYVFELKGEEKWPCICVIITILLIAIIGQIDRLRRRKLEPDRRKRIFKARMLTLLLAMAIIGQSVVYAARTTPFPFIYEGKLLDSSNNPITSMHVFRFSLWSSRDFTAGDVTGAGAINTVAGNYGGWWEAQAVIPNSDGTFAVELGNVTPLPNMDWTTHKFLQVEIKPQGSPDTAYELMDPSGDNGVDANDRQTIGSSPFTNNADFIDNAELGTGAGDIAILGPGGVWSVSQIPGGTDADSFVIDSDDTVGAGGTIDLQFGNTLAETLVFDITNDWFEFSNDLSMNQFEIKNFAIDNLAAPPGAPVTGQIYHNTTDGNTYIWNGLIWEDITAAAGGADLDTVYSADADKKMSVNNASGLEFESTVAGDIVFDLQSTGDLVVQDAGTPFAIFTDAGTVGIGTTTPSSIFHIDTNAANTTPILTLENTGGDLQFFRADATPEGSITGSIGDLVIDSTNGAAYIKNTGTATNTGWLQFGGQIRKEEVFNVEYEDAVAEMDGTNNKGILTSNFVDGGGTAKYNYYEWNTQKNTLQDVDLVISYKLPLDFQGFTATPLSVLYQTLNANLADNKIDVSLYDTTGTAVTLTGGSNLANGSWTTANITFGGSPTFTAGGTITLRLKLSATNIGLARVSDVVFEYNGL